MAYGQVLPFHIPFYIQKYIGNSRAYFGILSGQRKDTLLIHSIRMRIFSTRFGALLINSAVIICSKEGAWHAFEYIISIFINMKILFNEVNRLEA